MDMQRLILLFVFGFSVPILYEGWQAEHRPKPAPQAQSAQQQGVVPVPAAPAGQAAPAPATKGVPQAAAPAVPAAEAAPRGETVRVTTDVVIAEIDTLGGTLKRLELLKHKDTEDPKIGRASCRESG